MTTTPEPTPIFDELFDQVTPETQRLVLDCFDLSADTSLDSHAAV